MISPPRRLCFGSLLFLLGLSGVSAQQPGGYHESLATSISLVTEYNGSERPIGSVQYLQRTSFSIYPLLPAVFFAPGSTVIPERYIRTTVQSPSEQGSDPAARFDDIHGSMLDTYHTILDILGERMARIPGSRLTITGCSGSAGGGTAGIEVAHGRAIAVREYLAQRWGIERSRLPMVDRQLPLRPSNPRDNDGVEENHRVEFTADPPTLLDPVRRLDTVAELQPGKVWFLVRAEGAVARWKLSVLRNSDEVRTFEGVGSPPRRIDWPVNDDIAALTAGGRITYSIATYDSSGASVAAGPYGFYAERRRVGAADPAGYLNGGSNGAARSRGALLYRYGEREPMGVERSSADQMRNLLGPVGPVTVTGYTDRTGSAAFNARLARDRARIAATLVGRGESSARSYGEERPPFDNSLPEGRCYSRLVTVETGTPPP